MCYPKHKQILHKDDSVHDVIAKVFFNWKLDINHGKITSFKKITIIITKGTKWSNLNTKQKAPVIWP